VHTEAADKEESPEEEVIRRKHLVIFLRRCQLFCYKIAKHPGLELFVGFCIAINTITMSIYHDGMDPDIQHALEKANIGRSFKDSHGTVNKSTKHSCNSESSIRHYFSSARDKLKNVKRRVQLIVNSNYFETFVLTVIAISSIMLCFEDVRLPERPQLQKALFWLNVVFTIVFTLEMILKWIGIGFINYFSIGWNIVDFTVVLGSLLDLALGESQLSSLRAIRALRALRPLRAISRWKGMKVVVTSLLSAIPSILNVLLVCLLFWLIFCIIGVQIFAGLFYKCVNKDGERLQISEVNNKTECLAKNYSWVNSKVNFDNVPNGYLALYQVALFEGWMEIMEDAIDIRGKNLQPEKEANFIAYLYFVVYILFGSFFILNLFIGVIIDTFNVMKKKFEKGLAELMMSDVQRSFYHCMIKFGKRKPQKMVQQPKNIIGAHCYVIARGR
ncbi:sodium channel protein 1 brain-like, partial [Limulus polyphemus]|uniref:Sodium channel protein 1 brain-like n=1 Tax=Limulus polyphemus TaxID=6850 RepID=A0ABM1TR87_LIMPO